MNDTIITEILKSIENINKQEQEKYNITYLPLQQSIDILEKRTDLDPSASKLPPDVRSALATFNTVQNAKRRQKFSRTQDYDDLTGANKQVVELFDPKVYMSADENLENYLKPWGKLDKQQKINRLMSYVNVLKDDMSLTPVQITQLKQILIIAINEKHITKKTDVEYCEQTGSVLRIPALKLNTDTNLFYILNDLETNKAEITPSASIKITKTTAEKIQPVKKLNLNDLKQNIVKQKPQIVIKHK